jgi:hypothetical protein
MGLEEVKTSIRSLTVEERRKVALYILELEKQHLQDRVAPQLAEDIDGVSKVVQDAFEKLRKFVGKA